MSDLLQLRFLLSIVIYSCFYSFCCFYIFNFQEVVVFLARYEAEKGW